MLTEKQSTLLREVIDLNWEFTHETDWTKKWNMAKELNNKKKELRDDMGSDEYDKFMDNGRKMFAPLEQEEAE
jgi:hypothetical protein